MLSPRQCALWLPVVLLAAFAACSPTVAVATTCTSTPPLSATLRVAIVSHAFAVNNSNSPAHKLAGNPYMLKPSAFTSNAMALLQAAQLYNETLASIGGIPIGTNSIKLPLDLVYFNIGLAADASTSVAQWTTRATNLARQLANSTGPYGRFAFILTPAFSSTAKLPMQVAFMEACEESQTCITIGAVSAEPDQYICPTGAADCVARGRPVGSRRFKYGFSNFIDPTNDFSGHITGLRQSGLKTTALLFDSVGNNAATYTQSQRLAIQSGLTVVYKLAIPLQGAVNSDTGVTYTGTLSDLGMTSSEVVDQLIAANPASLLIATSVGQPSAVQIASILLGCKARGWWPASINFGGGVDLQILAGALMTADDLLYTSGMNPWSPLFQDTGYHAVGVTGVNYEMFESTATLDSPQVFSNAMDARWGVNSDKVAGYVFGAAMIGALQMVQKMVEITGSDDAPTISAAAPGISAPSVWGLIQFDPYGRPVIRNAALYQNVADPSTGLPNYKVMVYPPNIAVDLISPIPAFSERVFNPEYLSNVYDKIAVALSAVAMAYVACWMAFVCFYWRTAVIRASTPLFCLIILAGCELLLASNFFITTQSSNARCATQYWLLTLGFTLTFAPLFIKTWRIFRIFNVKKLVVQRLATSQLLIYLGVILVADMIIDAVWTGTGKTNVTLLTPDAYRPSKNQLICHGGNSTAFFGAHIAIKGMMTLVGMSLSWRVRKVDPTFNEAFHSMLVIYNLAMVSVFCIPMVAAQVGGSETSMLIQCLAVLFIATATATIMFAPKYFSLNIDVLPIGQQNKTALGTEGDTNSALPGSAHHTAGTPMRGSTAMGANLVHGNGKAQRSSPSESGLNVASSAPKVIVLNATLLTNNTANPSPTGSPHRPPIRINTRANDPSSAYAHSPSGSSTPVGTSTPTRRGMQMPTGSISAVGGLNAQQELLSMPGAIVQINNLTTLDKLAIPASQQQQLTAQSERPVVLHAAPGDLSVGTATASTVEPATGPPASLHRLPHSLVHPFPQ